MPPTPRAMKQLLWALAITFFASTLIERFFNFPISRVLGFVPYSVIHTGFIWQFLTYSFLHGNLWHLLWNGFTLWMLGSELMRLWGKKEFYKYFFVCVAGGSLTKLFLTYLVFPFLLGPEAALQSSTIPMVGASGAIYGLLVAYAIFFGDQVMYVMLLFPMKAKHVAVLLGFISFWQMFVEEGSAGGGVAHSAHLGGMLAGFLYLFFRTRRRLRSQKVKESDRDKLKTRFRVIINQNFSKDDNDDRSDPNRWN